MSQKPSPFQEAWSGRAMSTLIVERVAGLIFTEAAATFSPCRTWRYRLERTWNPDGPRMLWVMLNPSTADAFQLDPTVRRCMTFAKRDGYGSIEVVNLFALRSPDPKALYVHADPVGPDNEDQIRDACAAADLVVAAWGTHAARLAETVANMPPVVEDAAPELWCLGRTKDGSPIHPSARGRQRVPDNQPLVRFPS